MKKIIKQRKQYFKCWNCSCFFKSDEYFYDDIAEEYKDECPKCGKILYR